MLRLHEELTEAIALGHDLGHTPFGHAGERVIDELVPGGFNHYEQSLRIVDVLENDRQGLNLTWEVRDGIARHSKGKSGLPVGAAARSIARARSKGRSPASPTSSPTSTTTSTTRCAPGCCSEDDLPARRGRASSAEPPPSASAGMVTDVVKRTLAGGLTEVRMSEDVLDATLALRSFLFEAVYENEVATAEFKKAAGILGGLWEKVRERPDEFLDPRTIEAEGLDARGPGLPRRDDRPVRGELFEQLFIPKPWATADRPQMRRCDGIIAGLACGWIFRTLAIWPCTDGLDRPVGHTFEPSAFAEVEATRTIRVDRRRRSTLAVRRSTRTSDRFRLVGTRDHRAGAPLQPLPRAVYGFRVDAAFDLRYLPHADDRLGFRRRGAGSREKTTWTDDVITGTTRSTSAS